MKLGDMRVEKLVVGLFLLVTIIVMLVFLGFDKRKDNFSISSSSPSVNVSEIISKIKDENNNLQYESTNINEFTSLVFLDNERYKSILVDTNTGEELKFLDLIKENKIDEFESKELELLKLKYPEFIVNGINGKEGLKIYYVKDNEVIIFYYDFKFDYEYTETISLRINYNEIKDYINFTPNLDEYYENENGFNYSKDKKSIAITFDDGPSSIYNSLILEELEKNKAHATFFMVGTMMNSCQKCVIDTYNSGNEIGSHTYEHMNVKRNSISRVNESLNKTNSIYKKITGDDIYLFRPPYGAYSKTNLENIDNSLILWDIDTEDWRYRDAQHIVDVIMEKSKDGSVILMHELYETSYEALKIVLPMLYVEGYQVVSVSELATLKERSLEVGHVYGSFK